MSPEPQTPKLPCAGLGNLKVPLREGCVPTILACTAYGCSRECLGSDMGDAEFDL